MPWLVSGTVLAWLAARYPLAQVIRAIHDGHAMAMVPWAFLAVTGSLPLMAAADRVVFGRVLRSLTYLDVVKGRGGISVLQGFGYGAFSGGYGVWLARRTHADLPTAIGAIGYIALTDLGVVCLAALFGATAGRDALPASARDAVLTLAAAVALAVAAAGLFGSRLLRARHLQPWVHKLSVLRVWSRVPGGVYLTSSFLRLGNFTLFLLCNWAATRAFGLQIPFTTMAALYPVLVLVGSLPLNIGGLGAVQAVWVLLFERYAPGVQILAYQLLFQLMIALGILLRGLPFVRGLSRDLVCGAPPGGPAS